MKENVVIKKFPNGINLFLNDNISMEQLLDEIAIKFQQNRNFFRDSKIALGIEGRILTEEEERDIIHVIHTNCDLQIICLVGKNEQTDRSFVKALQKVEMQNTDNIGKFYL